MVSAEQRKPTEVYCNADGEVLEGVVPCSGGEVGIASGGWRRRRLVHSVKVRSRTSVNATNSLKIFMI